MINQTTGVGRFLPVLLALVSTVGAAVLLIRQDAARALAQAPSGDIPSEVTAFAFQLGMGIDGIALVDHKNQTLCIYHCDLSNPATHERLNLVAARNFSYDLQLTDFNNAEPRPDMVRQWVQRARQLQEPNRIGVQIIKREYLP